MVNALLKEIILREEELSGESIKSIYFGGGTPSLLSSEELTRLLAQMSTSFTLAENIEITLEANPDDLTLVKLKEIKKVGINRLSIGIQTFDDARLKFVNRAHTSKEAHESLKMAKEAGFTNISADLIYAIPPDEMSYWQSDLEQMIGHDLSHISLYGLTIEEKTVFGNWAKKKKLFPISEETAADQYRMAVEMLTDRGFVHYEVSNFAKPNMESKHNSGYWAGAKYLGIGPGAHSYDGQKRSFNVSNNLKYIAALGKDKIPQTVEELSKTDQINEYLFTHLRTRKGINLDELNFKYGIQLIEDRSTEIEEFVNQQLVVCNESQISLTSEGLMLADEITMRLFYED